MRIAHVISSLKMGGAESLLVDLVNYFKESGDEHIVIYFHEGHYTEILRQQEVELYKIEGFISLYDPLFVLRLYRIIKKIKPDYIHGWLWAANFLSRMIAYYLGIKCISSLHNNLDQDGMVRNLIDKYTYKYATALIPVSDGVAHSLRSTLSPSFLPNVYVVKNGINYERLLIKAQGNEEKIDFFKDDNFIIGSVGRFVPLKNYGLLIDAFAVVHKKHMHARLVLVGVGSEEKKLREQVTRLEIEHAVLFVINQPAYKYYPFFDCFALSSYKEGISIALLEAMSFGLPSVILNSESHTHDVIINKHNGLLVAQKSVHEFAETLTLLIENNQLSKQIGQAAVSTVRNDFSIKKMAEKYKNIYGTLISL